MQRRAVAFTRILAVKAWNLFVFIFSSPDYAGWAGNFYIN